ncbi:MAG: leucine-rich repeat domain-containing protein [Tidjanibacter sp.]|nr:leucine-rich repeat domain-containing protein [Tidjanibacter sp.]
MKTSIRIAASLVAALVVVACSNPDSNIVVGSLDNITCNDNQIYYTSKSGAAIQLPATQGFGSNITGNTYQNGIGCITFDGNITTLPDYAFKNCTQLLDISLPSTLSSIGRCAFQNCYMLTELTLPNSVTEIDELAFLGCYGLTSVELGNGLLSIGNEAFKACSALSTLSLPESLVYIGENAFPENIRYDIPEEFCITYRTTSNGDKISEVYPESFGADYVLRHTYKNNTGRIVLNRRPTKVWLRSDQITEVVLPESVKEITGQAFYNNFNLTKVNFPKGLTVIGQMAFQNTSITEASIPSGVAVVEDHAFMGCLELSKVSIANGVEKIEEYAFEGCGKLSEITIPESVTYIGSYAFPSSTTVSLPEDFYIDYTASQQIYVDPSKVDANYIISHSFQVYNGVGRVGFNKPITRLYNSCFHGKTTLTGITFPKSLTAIGQSVFYGCTNLTNVELPECLTDIPYRAFYGCSSLRSITIPKNVTHIGEFAFAECRQLSEVYLLPTTPPTLKDSRVFENIATTHKFYVPEASYTAYKEAEYWSSYTDFITWE